LEFYEYRVQFKARESGIRGTGELAHVLVKRVSGTVEAEYQGAVPVRGMFRARGLGVGNPFTLAVVDRFVGKTRGRVGGGSFGDVSWCEWGNGGHLGGWRK
jgi:hypothetical protein